LRETVVQGTRIASSRIDEEVDQLICASFLPNRCKNRFKISFSIYERLVSLSEAGDDDERISTISCSFGFVSLIHLVGQGGFF
jgi:hypothetical protein